MITLLLPPVRFGRGMYRMPFSSSRRADDYDDGRRWKGEPCGRFLSLVRRFFRKYRKGIARLAFLQDPILFR
jgi:hypothetical protein